MIPTALLTCFHVAAADVHLGVATCAGSTCHGATRAFADARIRQDEYFVWQRQDPHARAYRDLQGELSRGIAAKLGLGRAEQAPACLVCHSDNVPATLRGERFQVDDGIGCEACHGGAERWIAPHAKGYRNNEERVAAGLVPGWRPEVRAKLCASCHVGDDEHPVSHAMMAAGHPPLLFELDTYTAIEPMHWDVDADYIERKSAQEPARNWAAGQAAAARVLLQNVAGNRFAHGSFPELSFFDCDACHHSMHAGRASSIRNGGMAIGTPPLSDTPIVMLNLWLDAEQPALGKSWREQWRALHAATQRGVADVQIEARRMVAELDRKIVPLASGVSLSSAHLRGLLRGLVAEAQTAHAGDFSHAEQTAMAVSVLTTALTDQGVMTVGVPLRTAVDGLYEQVRDRDLFKPGDYAAALTRVSAALGP